MSISKNVERAFDTVIAGQAYYEREDTLRAFIDGAFYYKGTKIAQAVYDDNSDSQFIVLPILDFKTDKGWKAMKKAIAKKANEFGYYVIFDENFDFEFGKLQPAMKEWYEPISVKYIYSKLLYVANYSLDKDIKTAACTVEPGFSEVPDKILAYSYNQKLGNNKVYEHAEKIVTKYMEIITDAIFQSPIWYSLLEPCENCLEAMIETGAEQIYYGKLHKEKWNTQEYIQLTNDIFAKNILSKRSRPIKYRLISDKRIDTFYNRRTK